MVRNTSKSPRLQRDGGLNPRGTTLLDPNRKLNAPNRVHSINNGCRRAPLRPHMRQFTEPTPGSASSSFRIGFHHPDSLQHGLCRVLSRSSLLRRFSFYTLYPEQSGKINLSHASFLKKYIPYYATIRVHNVHNQ